MNQPKLKFGHDFQPIEVEIIDTKNDTTMFEEMCKVCGGDKYDHETKESRYRESNTILQNIIAQATRLEQGFNQYPSMK